MKKILNIINQILGVTAYGSGMTLVVIGLSSGFSVLELVLINMYGHSVRWFVQDIEKP